MGADLSGEKAGAVRRVLEEQVDDVVLNGVSEFSWDGLLNHSTADKFDVPADGTGSSPALEHEDCRAYRA